MKLRVGWSRFAALGLALCAVPAGGSDPGALADADRALGEAAARLAPAEGLAAALTADAVALLDGAPILTGREAVRSQAMAHELLAGRSLQWQPLRAEVSSDGSAGFTFGVAAALAGEARSPARIGRYLAFWRFEPTAGWRAAAWALLLPAPFDKPAFAAATDPAPPAALPGGPLAAADRAFARLAEQGVGAAFGAYAAPDAVMFGGRGIALRGPQEVAGAFAGWAPTTRLEWAPRQAWLAASGHLGFTIGEAVYSQVSDKGERQRSGTKYLTIWRHQPDGSWKFAIDGGNSRPLAD